MRMKIVTSLNGYKIEYKIIQKTSMSKGIKQHISSPQAAQLPTQRTNPHN